MAQADDDLDLAVGHCGENEEGPVLQSAVVYENDADAGTLRLAPDETPKAGWVSPEPLCVNDVAWGDWDNDTDLDLALGARIFENHFDDLELNDSREHFLLVQDRANSGDHRRGNAPASSNFCCSFVL